MKFARVEPCSLGEVRHGTSSLQRGFTLPNHVEKVGDQLQVSLENSNRRWIDQMELSRLTPTPPLH